MVPQFVGFYPWKTYKVRNLYTGTLSKRDETDLSRKHMLKIIPHFAGFFEKVWGLEIKILNFPKEIPPFVGIFTKCSKMASESEEFPQIDKIPQFAVEISLESLRLQEPHTQLPTHWQLL